MPELKEDENFTERMDVRVTPSMKLKFAAKCRELHRTPQSLIREMVEAIADGRLKITPTEDQLNSQQEIYHVN